ncbi:MAG: hypothetical protein LQ343_006215 [Gyalolechia ehrenbergii]|nr:MAG: hypothetical protein LQ343_006215 [Gyalolechia ehrenbergii]
MAASYIQQDIRHGDLRKPLSPLPTSALNTRRPNAGSSKPKHRTQAPQHKKHLTVSPAFAQHPQTYSDVRHQTRQSSNPKTCTRVPKTKPNEVQELWRHVRAELYRTKMMSKEDDNRGTTSDSTGSKSRRKRTPTQTAVTSESSIDVPTSVGEKDDSGPATVISSAGASSKRIGPYNTNFRSVVLAPRGISFKLEQRYTSPWHHFGSAAPKTNTASYYDKHCSGMKELWLDANEDFTSDVVHEYNYMHSTRCCEAEFAAYAREHLVKGAKRYLPTDSKVKRQFRCVRMLELVSKPQEPTWKMPPIVHQGMHSETYDFDIRPDCSFWLSHAGFNPDYASLISLWVQLIALHSISNPYLFVEFKRDGKSTLTVENQLATVASLALHNRFHLRLNRIAKAASTWSEVGNESEIKVYGITFEGTGYVVWCVTPDMTADFQWNGCSLTRVGHGNCTSSVDLKRLIGWINEIHCWGLTRHAQSCQDDIKICLRDDDNDFDVSELLETLEDI